MANKFNDLPPSKRYRLLHEQENQSIAPSPSCLPAKKRKEARSFPPALPSPSSTFCLPAKKRKDARSFPPALPPPSGTFCLPAKKRIWALHEFDLNLEFQPRSENEKPGEEAIQNPSEKKQSEGKIQTPMVKQPRAETKEEDIKSEAKIQTPKAEKLRARGEDEGNKLEEMIQTPMAKKLREQSEDEGNDEEDDGILCAICESTDGDPSDPIVFCDGCELMVHANCYGHPLANGVPEGDWFCAECQSSKPGKTSVKCSLCPVLGGALKPTTDAGKWAHVVCALFVPEVFFRDPEGREEIDMTQVPNRRWKHKCYICKSRNGCAIDCSEERCPLAFHVTCGIKKDLCIEYKEGRNKTDVVAGFCRAHSDLWRKQQKSGKYKIVPEKH